MFGPSTAAHSTIDQDIHRMRRSAFAPFFSKQSVRRLEPLIQSSVNKLCSKLKNRQSTEDSVNILHAYSALTADIITTYCFTKLYDLLDLPTFGRELYSTILGTSEGSHLLQQCAWLFSVMNYLPLWVVERVHPNLYKLLTFQQDLLRQIRDIKDGG